MLVQVTRPDINGKWEADVTYDWQDARYVERFVFQGDGEDVYKTASFLGTQRGILEDITTKNGLRFITRTQDFLGGDRNNSKKVVHQYRGTLQGNEITFMMQTEGGYSEHVPIEFRAPKRADTTPQPNH
jgi:uncharacterized FAD-dependent dehydrogenase